MRRALTKNNIFLISASIFIVAYFCSAQSAAAKGLTLTQNVTNIAVGDTVEVAVTINTEGESLNAVGFNIDFPTEELEGLLPNRAGTVFPWWITESATKINCGVQNTGFSGQGLITTLKFKGRKPGTVNISLSSVKAVFLDTLLSGYTSNSVVINIHESAETIDNGDTSGAGSIIIPPTTQDTSNYTPNQTAAPVAIQPEESSETFGSLAQVLGPKGSQPEDTLKAADSSAEASVKGIFGKNSILWSSVLPTILLLAIIIYLALRLFLTEKRRHLNMERIFDKQLGTLAALESKIDLIEEKGEEGKNQYLQEIEQAKNELKAQNDNGAKAANLASEIPAK